MEMARVLKVPPLLTLIVVQSVLGTSLPEHRATKILPSSHFWFDSPEAISTMESTEILDFSGISTIPRASSPSSSRFNISPTISSCSNRLRYLLADLCGRPVSQPVGQDCCLRPCTLAQLRKYCGGGNGGLFVDTAEVNEFSNEIPVSYTGLRMKDNAGEPNSESSLAETRPMMDMAAPNPHSSQPTCQNRIRGKCGRDLTIILHKVCNSSFNRPMERQKRRLMKRSFLFSRVPRAGVADECCRESCCLDDIKKKYCRNSRVPKSQSLLGQLVKGFIMNFHKIIPHEELMFGFSFIHNGNGTGQSDISNQKQIASPSNPVNGTNVVTSPYPTEVFRVGPHMKEFPIPMPE